MVSWVVRVGYCKDLQRENVDNGGTGTRLGARGMVVNKAGAAEMPSGTPEGTVGTNASQGRSAEKKFQSEIFCNKVKLRAVGDGSP
jgi:hypothetical protein